MAHLKYFTWHTLVILFFLFVVSCAKNSQAAEAPPPCSYEKCIELLDQTVRMGTFSGKGERTRSICRAADQAAYLAGVIKKYYIDELRADKRLQPSDLNRSVAKLRRRCAIASGRSRPRPLPE